MFDFENSFGNYPASFILVLKEKSIPIHFGSFGNVKWIIRKYRKKSNSDPKSSLILF